MSFERNLSAQHDIPRRHVLYIGRDKGFENTAVGPGSVNEE
jgi:hypothetical protein